VLVQEYIDRPLLLQERKFDLRIYVLVTSFDPLRAYTFEQGLARFATNPYAPPMGDSHDRCAQLTNYSINKKNGAYEANADAADDATGHKWSLAAAFRALAELGHDVDALQRRIDGLLAKTLIAAQPAVCQKYNSYFRRRNAAFELFGFDVMLDSELRPWLIEVNVSPDLASTSPLDRLLKGTLAADTLHLVGIRAPAPLAAAVGAPAPPAPHPNEPPLFTRHQSSGHQPTEMDSLPVRAPPPPPDPPPLPRPPAPTRARPRPAAQFSKLSDAERLLCVETEEEWHRAAMTGFRRIYPSPHDGAQQRLLRLFETVRGPDALISAYSRRAGRLAELQAAIDSAPPPSGRTSHRDALAMPRVPYKPDVRQWAPRATATTPARAAHTPGGPKPRSSSSRSVHRHASRTRANAHGRAPAARASSARANLTPSKGGKARTPAARRTPAHGARPQSHAGLAGGTPKR
jgi:hypothetical protein